MNIVIATKIFHPVLGGVSVYVDSLAKAFVQIGHSVTVVTRTPSGSFSDEKQNYCYHLLRLPKMSELIGLAKKCDILLQTESSWKDALPFLMLKVPWFPTIHRGIGETPRSCNGRIRLALERLAFSTGNTISISNWIKKDWSIEGEVILNPYDDSVYKNVNKERDYHFIFVGRIVESKGVLQLMSALSKLDLSDKKKKIRVAVIGEGQELDKMKSLVSKLPEEVKVDFYGRLDPPEVAVLLNRSITLVFPTMPSWKEASPLTPLEAIACGCRVIAADSGGTKENLADLSRLYPSGNEAHLIDALNKDLLNLNEEVIDEEFLLERKLYVVGRKYIDYFELIANAKMFKSKT